MATTTLEGEAAAPGAVGRAEPLDAPSTLMCSWCRSVISRAPRRPVGAKSYGMCRGCLSHNLLRLDIRGTAS